MKGGTTIPEKIAESVNRIQEAFRRLPKADAELVANDAAIRAEAIADYMDMVSRAMQASGTVDGTGGASN